MKKRLILSIFIILLSVSLLVIFSTSGVRAYKIRKREWYIKNVNPNIRIEVINASGVKGLARKVTVLLREEGFDVIYYAHIDSTIEKTVVVERSDSSLTHARHLAKWLGVKEVALEWDFDKISDCSLVIGTDFRRYFPGIDTIDLIY
ncbi:MAG: LytR C-terminal domain-containing protein [candidate division WOR-3 bacterium]